MHNRAWQRDGLLNMSNYLQEQSAGEILRGTINIYGRNFLRLWGMYLIPTSPFLLLKLKRLEWSHTKYDPLLSVVMWALVTPFAAAALTVGVSDICIGNRPSIFRSLWRVFGTILGKLVVTNLFMYSILAGALVPAVLFLPLLFATIPLTLLFLVWWMFVPTVVVLERTLGWTSLKRSKALGKGFYIRNGGLVLLLYLPTLILRLGISHSLQVSSSDILKMLGIALEGAIAPLPLIATVLLYYDLRTRSEGYDLAMLGQDLRR